MSSLLLEIGVEELPSSYVDAALAALPTLATTMLDGLRLSRGEISALGTPRRLALLIRDLAEKQADLDEEVQGPPESAAYKDGKPTKAAEAFAEKLGIALDALVVRDMPAIGNKKAGKYLVGRKQEKGRAAADLLGPALAELCGKIPFRKSMRWGTGSTPFGRPVQWLVALQGSAIIDFSFAEVRSSNKTRGHRFLAPKEFTLENADAYVAALRAAHVLVDRKERADTMMALVKKSAEEVGGTYDKDPYLVDENASLVEEPHVIRGDFEAKYLELPAAVIRAVARGHQKYFCIEKNADTLLPHYIAVANTANSIANVKKGNDRAMRPRLADAQFFFEEDKKASLDDRVKKLEGIVFHARLGTVREKVARIEALALHIGQLLGTDAKDLGRAAILCKSDLVSLMVGEFPELQGLMGREYALHAKESVAVADAIRDHYRPVGATDDLPAGEVSRIIALADRLDTLVGCFAVGLSPTGSADPFALRRACIAVLRLLMENSGAKLSAVPLDALFAQAYEGFAAKKLDLTSQDTIAKLREFTKERLRGLLTAASSNDVADAVLAGTNFAEGAKPAEFYPAYALAKALAVKAVVDAKEPWLEKAKTVAKRLNGISKDAKSVLHGKNSFSSDKDAAIVEVVEAIDQATRSLLTKDDVTNALKHVAHAATRVDEIFTTTLVNDPADLLTPKRLELLSFGAECMLRIADFSRLSA